MKNTYKDAGYTYTINRLQETARTFRNLGDAYGETNQKQTGFKRQLILAADILEECVAMNLMLKRRINRNAGNLSVNVWQWGYLLRI